MGRFIEVFWSLVEWIVGPLPGALGRRIRYVYYKQRLRHIGKGVVIDVGVRIVSPQHVSIGDNTWIDNYVIILAGPPRGGDGRILTRKANAAFMHGEGEVVIGQNCHVANFVVLQGHGGLSIGDDTGIATGCQLYSMSHHYCDPSNRSNPKVFKFTPMAPAKDQSLIVSPVVMERDTALGLNSVMLPGATIREGSWVASNSLVSKEIAPFCIASGSPAQAVSQRAR